MATIAQVERILNSGIENACGLTVHKFEWRTHDDHDGDWTGKIMAGIGPDGDAYIATDASNPIRFRTTFGGGRSPRVYNALLIIAKAIQMDNEQTPEPPCT